MPGTRTVTAGPISVLSLSGCSEETEHNQPLRRTVVRTNERIICPGRTHQKKDPFLRGAPKNIAAPPAKTLLTREAGRGPGLARLADDCSRRAKAVAEIQWRRTLPSTHHSPPLPRPRHPREPPRLPARSPPTSSASGLRHRMGTAEMLLLQVGDPVVATAEKVVPGLLGMGNINDALPIAASLSASSQQAQGQAAHGQQQAESTSRSTAVPLAADVELVDDAQAGQGLQDGAGTLQCTLPPSPPRPPPSIPGQRPAPLGCPRA